MRCGLWVLLFLLGVAFGQEAEDDGEDLVIDDVPESPPEEEKAPKKEPVHPPAREGGKRPRCVPVKKGVYTLSLPEDWEVTEFDAAKAEAGWNVWLPGAQVEARLLILRVDGIPDPRSGPYRQRDGLKEPPEAKVEVHASPVPWIAVHRADYPWMHVYWSIRNNVFAVELMCAPEDFDQAAADLVAAAKKFDADVGLWPPLPEGYESKKKGPWLIARHPDVKGSLAQLERGLKAAEKRFKHTHGSLPKSDAPLVVLVHASDGDAARIEPKVAENGHNGFYADLAHHRLFAVVPAKDDLEQQGALAGEAHRLLFLARYGDVRPWWLCTGGSTVARVEAMTGADLPEVHEGFTSWWGDLTLHRPDEMEAEIEAGSKQWGMEAFFYAAMFHDGRFRKEYRAYLDDFSETGDGQGAYDRHLGTLDPEEVRSAVKEYYYRMKPVHPK